MNAGGAPEPARPSGPAAPLMPDDLIPQIDLKRTARRLPAAQDWWVTYVLIGFLTVLAGAGALAAAIMILAPIAHLLVILMLGITVAFALSPLVRLTERAVGRRRRVAVAVVIVGMIALVTATILVFAIPTITEFQRLALALPQYSATLERGEDLALGSLVVPNSIARRALAFVDPGTIAPEAGALTLRLASSIFDIVIVTVIALYFLLDGRRFRALALRAVRTDRRRKIRAIEREVVRVFGAYLRGQLILAASVGILVTIVLTVLGMPYAFLLGAFASLAELIPIAGPILSSVPAILVALLQPFPMVVFVAVAFLIIQQVESNVLMPRVSGHAVGMHPLGALVALFAGFEVGGILGALFAVPLAGLLTVFVGAAVGASRGRQMVLVRPLARGRRLRAAALAPRPPGPTGGD
ncbi:MAG: AI-2E family transporter [Candidatus Limnocylindria bacterium]